jgi:hypothetical protein
VRNSRQCHFRRPEHDRNGIDGARRSQAVSRRQPYSQLVRDQLWQRTDSGQQWVVLVWAEWRSRCSLRSELRHRPSHPGRERLLRNGPGSYGHADSDTDANTDAYTPAADFDADTDSNTHTDTDSNAHTHINADSADCYRNSDARPTHRGSHCDRDLDTDAGSFDHDSHIDADADPNRSATDRHADRDGNTDFDSDSDPHTDLHADPGSTLRDSDTGDVAFCSEQPVGDGNVVEPNRCRMG